MKRTQLRLLIFYEFKLGHNAREAYENINIAFGEGTISDSTVKRWYKNFKDDKENFEDKPRSGRPSVINDAELKAAVEEDPRQTLVDLASRFKVSESTISDHLKLIGKAKKLNTWVPHQLDKDQDT